MRGEWILIGALMATSCAESKNLPSERAPANPNKLSCEAQFQSGQCVSLAWVKKPRDQADGSFTFSLFRQNPNKDVNSLEDWTGQIAVVMWMPSMGHGVHEQVIVERLSAGVYRATNVHVSMRGAWEVRIQLKDGDEVKYQAIIPITF